MQICYSISAGTCVLIEPMFQDLDDFSDYIPGDELIEKYDTF